MSNLDKSLGELISSRKTSTRGRAVRGRRGGAQAPVGGVRKNVANKASAAVSTKGATRATGRAAATNAPAASTKGGNKKILVSGLPLDVGDSHLKEYFSERVGPILRTEISYDQRGKSRGIATVIFRQPLAEKAVAEHNGITIEGKPLRVEVVYDAHHLPPQQPAKSLGDRLDKSKKETAAKKDKPKKVDAVKKERNATTAGETGRGKRGRNAGRPKKKTAEELDMEMTDYFGVGGQPAQATGEAAGSANAPATGPAAAADAMEEEVL